jgi:hypothetical protein
MRSESHRGVQDVSLPARRRVPEGVGDDRKPPQRDCWLGDCWWVPGGPVQLVKEQLGNDVQAGEEVAEARRVCGGAGSRWPRLAVQVSRGWQ